jgi:hypothetical protein
MIGGGNFPTPVHHGGDERLVDKLPLAQPKGLAFPVDTTQQLILHSCAPAGFLLLFFVLGPGDGFSVQIFLRIGDNQFDRLGLRFRFHRPGFGYFEILHISHLPF